MGEEQSPLDSSLIARSPVSVLKTDYFTGAHRTLICSLRGDGYKHIYVIGNVEKPVLNNHLSEERQSFSCEASGGPHFWGTLMRGFELILCSWKQKHIRSDSSSNFQHHNAVTVRLVLYCTFIVFFFKLGLFGILQAFDWTLVYAAVKTRSNILHSDHRSLRKVWYFHVL